MNKLKLLIPTLSVATVATGIFTTTSCSKNVTINLDNLTKVRGDTKAFDALTTKKPIEYKQGTTYTVIADLSLFKNNDDEPDVHFEVMMTRSLQKINTPNFNYTKLDIWSGKTKLEEVDEDDIFDRSNCYALVKSAKGSGIVIALDETFSKDTIKMEFQITPSVEEQYLVFVEESGL